MLVLGSSLTVSPAANMAGSVSKYGKLVICNLQRTPYDKYSKMRVGANIDAFMNLVMDELKLEIPPFILHRQVLIQTKNLEDKLRVEGLGIDVDSVPSSFIKALVFKGGGIKQKHGIFKKEPFFVEIDQASEGSLTIELQFMGHYNEPHFNIFLPLCKEAKNILYKISFNPKTDVWTLDSTTH
eukprot:TRINITY_DN15879_c0_g1_i1.p1 TRINITY_DN15879_c0_g1~~TRINITY_DN15879_c0_g1_i1.p1  ORF type:complete len:183 (+),score=23.43 TRINITY_DN15879_c0_g1_i1:272-820(+)